MAEDGSGRLREDRLLERLAELPVGALALKAFAGHERVHAVGGAVRDLLLDRPFRELDLVVEGHAIGLARRVARELRGEVTVHERFGTATVQAGGLAFDLAAARRETYTRPGALPDVEVGVTLAEDLPRRDFTVNAIALALADGRLTAVDGARDDLAARRLRVLHDRSFLDDPTRLLRLARYAGRLNFSIEAHTEALARAAIAAHALRTLSGARLGRELRLLAAEDDPLAALSALSVLGLDEALLAPADLERAAAALTLCPADGRRGLLAFAAAWGENVGPDLLRARLRDLEWPARDREGVAELAHLAPKLARGLRAAGDAASAAAEVVGGAPPEAVALAGALEPRAAAAAGRWLREWRHVRPAITGADLVAAGAEPGPALAVALRAALHAKLDGAATTRDDELAVALRVLRGG